MREHASVQKSDEKRLKSDWQEKLNIAESCENHRHEFCALLEKFVYTWEGHLGRTSTVIHHFELTGDDIPLVHLAQYKARPTT